MNNPLTPLENFYVKLQKNIKKAVKSGYDVSFLKAETGLVIHIALDEFMYCQMAGKMSKYKENIKIKDIIETYEINDKTGEAVNVTVSLCKMCRTFFLIDFNGDSEPSIDWFNKFPVMWKCDAFVKKKGNKNTRCKNITKDLYASFCSQHNQCFYKYIEKHINLPKDISKLVIGLL